MKAKTIAERDFEKLLRTAPDSLRAMSETLKFSTSNDLQMASGCLREAAHLLDRALIYLQKGNAIDFDEARGGLTGSEKVFRMARLSGA